MNDPITLYNIGSSLNQEYISKASGNARHKALKNITCSNKRRCYNWLSLTLYLSWMKNLASKEKKRMATPRKCTCPT